MIPPDAIDKMKTAAILLPGDGERLSVIGDAQTIKLDGAMTNGLFAMIEQNNDQGAGVPLHVHTREDETFYVCEGEVTFQIGEIAGSSPWFSRGQTDARATECLSGGRRRDVSRTKQIAPGPPDMVQVTRICAEYGIYFL